AGSPASPRVPVAGARSFHDLFFTVAGRHRPYSGSRSGDGPLIPTPDRTGPSSLSSYRHLVRHPSHVVTCLPGRPRKPHRVVNGRSARVVVQVPVQVGPVRETLAQPFHPGPQGGGPVARPGLGRSLVQP